MSAARRRLPSTTPAGGAWMCRTIGALKARSASRIPPAPGAARCPAGSGGTASPSPCVRLVASDPVHVDHWGTYVTTPSVTDDSTRVTIRTTLRDERHSGQRVALQTTLFDSAGNHLASVSTVVDVPGDSVVTIAQDFTLPHPVRWSLERPYMYHARSEVRGGHKICDSYTTPFGVRSFEL